MLRVLLALPILAVLTSQEPPRPSPADRHRFEAAKTEAGKDPANLVKLALWCETHGLRAERRAVLEEAVRLDPNQSAARGLLGQVSYQGRWETPETVSQQVKKDEALMAKLAEYNTRRNRIDHLAELEQREIQEVKRRGHTNKAMPLKTQIDRKLAPEHLRLGLWCEENGLKPQALAHFTKSLQLDSYHEPTLRHLGYVKHHGRWMSHEQIAADQREALAEKHAAEHWEPRLRKWAEDLRLPSRRAAAEAELAKVTDPHAVRSIVRLFAEKTPDSQLMAARLLRQINAPAATRELAYLAIHGAEAETRTTASQSLRGREPRDYAGALVNLIQTATRF